jgi:hypothetical protein
MAVALQDRYSKLVEAKLAAEIVQKDGVIWNNDYEGDPKAGAVKIPVRGAATVVSYDKQNGAAKSYAAGSYDTLVIDKDKAVNEVIDGYDADAVPDNIVANRLDAAAEGLALQINSDGTVELLDKASVNGTSSATDKTNVYDRMVEIGKVMSKNFVPKTGRWALINPDTMALVRKSSEFTSASQLGDTVKQSGAVGMIAGFMVFEDATLPAHANIICGHKNWCCRVNEWTVNVHLQSLDGSGDYIGASAVQGRRVYGHKVTNSKAVVMDSGVLLPTVAIASHTATVTLTSTNATGAKYRIKHGDTWGDWTTYNGSSKPTTQAGDTIEVYGFDADGVRSGIVSQIDS